MSDLIKKLKKNSKLQYANVIDSSKIYKSRECVTTDIPMINVALSGMLDGGIEPGILTLAGPSKHFKSGFALLLAKAFQNTYPEGVVLFYDSEFGIPKSYLETFELDTSRILHLPVSTIEELKFDIVKQLDALEEDDRVFILIDSIGNLASKKELTDAENEKSVTDMTRAKDLKALFRIVTTKVRLKSAYLVAVNHTYAELSLYPRQIVSGGTGIYYSSQDVWILGRRQDKEKQEIKGYDFIINIEKSRKVKEGSKIPISISFEDGVDNFSGLFDIAVEAKFIDNSTKGWYQKINPETGELIGDKVRKKDLIEDKEFWNDLINNKEFQQYISKRFKL